MHRSSAGGRTSFGTAPLRSVNGPGSVPRNRGSKIPQGSGRSSFGGRSSIGTGGKFSLSASNRLSVAQKRSIGLVTKPGASSRRSSGYGRGYGSDTLKDPRPISNKQFKDRSIKKLIEFLAFNGYPHQLSPKMLVSPMTRDFLHIFEFMVRFIDPSIKLSSKPEEEVPLIFKRLRYPFSISKSALFAVGSPHTWPSLLAGLTWLREIIECMVQIEADKELFMPTNFDFDGTNEMKYLFEYCELAYREFLEGADSFDALEADLENKIKTCGEMADMEHLAEENRAFKEELALLHNQPDQLLACKQKFNTLSLDLEKIRNYHAKLEQHCKAQGDNIEQQDSEIAQLEAELEALVVDNKKKQHIFETQEFTREDIERINLDRERLSESIETVEEDVKNQDQDIWNLEMSNAKIATRIETKCAEYNQACIQMAIVPASGDVESGPDFRVTGKPHRHREEAENFNKVIKPGLIQLWTQANQEVHQAAEEHITLTDTVDQMSEMVNEKLQAISLNEAKHKRSEDAIESEKQIHASDQKTLQDAIFKLQDDLIELRKVSSLSENESKRHLEDEKAKFRVLEEERRNLEKASCQFLEQVVELIVSHKTSIQENTSAMKSKLEAAHQKNREYIQGRGYLQGKTE